MNINGLNKPPIGFFQQLMSQYSLIAFQETRFKSSDVVRRVTHFSKVIDSKSLCFWSHKTDPNFSVERGRDGVGLIFSGQHPFHEVIDVTGNYISSADVLDQHYLVVKAQIDDFTIFIHVVYAPVQVADRTLFFSALPTDFPDRSHHLVMGDFNVPMDPIMDEIIPYHHDLGRTEFFDWQLKLGVIDAWRNWYPDRREFTGPGRKNRIDYVFLSPTLLMDNLREISHVTDTSFFHEDHLPLRFSLQSQNLPETAPLPWKCPRWILQNAVVHRVLEWNLDRLCDRLRNDINANPGALLDEHKRADAIFLREMAREFQNQDKSTHSRLKRDLYEAETLHAHSPTDNTAMDVANAKADLEIFTEDQNARRQQTKFDSDVRCGETGNKHFLRKPYNANMRVAIPNVRLSDGTTSAHPGLMVATHRKYWGEIFQSPSWDLQPQISKRHFQPVELLKILEHTTARLSLDDQRYLDSPMTAHEFFWAIKTTATGKSSGLDGIPAEYYQLFPHKWAQVYELVYASQFNKGRMTKFQRRAYISLLYKKGDRSLPENYRPLTLLNHDAKFGPKIASYRLQKILPKLLHPDQFGFTKGRSIRHALIEFQDLQQLARNMGLKNAGAVLLDFAKAFDSVLWPALDLVLKHYGFGANFRNVIRTFYKGTIVTVLVNGVASEYFELGCGVRQGDPLSPALFVLFLEPMLNYLRWKTGHLGIHTPNSTSPHHLLAFADDCTGVLEDLRHTRIFIDTVQYYSDAAGLTLNSAKTIILPFQQIGRELRNEISIEGLHVVANDGTTKLLGVAQSPSLHISTRFDSVIPKMVERCQLWKYRGRTIRGRAVILRTIVLPLFWYTAAVTPVPDKIVDQVRNLCKSFLFKKPIDENESATGYFAEEWLYWPSTKGGLGLPETAAFSNALRLCTLRDSIVSAGSSLEIPRWFQPAASIFTECLHGSGTAFDMLYVQIPRTTPAPARWAPIGTFWFSTLQAWRKLREKELNKEILLRHRFEMPIWLNFLFTVQAKRKPLEGSSNLAEHFRALGYIRLRDFFVKHGQNISKSLCISILEDIEFGSPRLRTLAASHFLKQLGSWELIPRTTYCGPYVPVEVTSACHSWSFKGMLISRMRNRDFYKLLHKLPTIPTLPHTALDLAMEPDWDKIWRTELNMDKMLLPILGDLKFRMQHNGLNVRRKHQYHTDDTNCPHGCSATETIKHLFWDCPVAKVVWRRILDCISQFVQDEIAWESVVYLLNLNFKRHSIERYGHRNLTIMFNVIRSSILYPTWIHRNHKIFNNVQTSAIYVGCRALAYTKLHLRRIETTTMCPKLTGLVTAVLTSVDNISTNSFGNLTTPPGHQN